VDSSNARIDHTSAAQRKEQAAGGYEVSVEAFEEREQGGGEDDIHDPARAQRLLEGHGRHEFLAGQLAPGATNATAARCSVEAMPMRLPSVARERSPGCGDQGWLLRRLANGFKTSHEVGTI
jgi:hypothetical protein